jgi:hypothetical protein
VAADAGRAAIVFGDRLRLGAADNDGDEPVISLQQRLPD